MSVNRNTRSSVSCSEGRLSEAGGALCDRVVSAGRGGGGILSVGCSSVI